MANEEKAVYWTPLVGKWKVAANGIKYRDAKLPSSDVPSEYGICLSSLFLDEGQVSFDLQTSAEAARILLGFRSENDPYLTVGLGGYGNAYVISEFQPSIGWSRLAGVGRSKELDGQRSYHLSVVLREKSIALLVDGVEVLRHRLERQMGPGRIGLFCYGDVGVARFKNLRIDERGTAFVVMQFTASYRDLFETVILPAAAKSGLKAHFGAKVFGPNLILKDIQDSIKSAKVVIAEITPENPNIFYEIGYAQALDKPTIMIAEIGKKLPFDVRGFRVIFYENTDSGKLLMKRELIEHLDAIEQASIERK